MELSVETLFEREAQREPPPLPNGLRARYGGDLRLPSTPPERSYVVANFVSTLDGVVTFDIPGEAGGTPIGGENAGDRFIMSCQLGWFADFESVPARKGPMSRYPTSRQAKGTPEFLPSDGLAACVFLAAPAAVVHFSARGQLPDAEYV